MQRLHAPQSAASFGCPRPLSQPHTNHSVRRQRQRQRRSRGTRCCADQHDWPASSTVDLCKSRRQALLEYAENVDPKLTTEFSQTGPNVVVDAMRTSLRTTLGTLPPQFFNVQITSRTDSFANLIGSHLMAGYMFRNARFRMDLGKNFGTALLPPADTPAGVLLSPAQPVVEGVGVSEAVAAPENDMLYAPGTQKTRVSGEVLRWHLEKGTEAICAKEYIDSLESEVTNLKREMANLKRGLSASRNDLLEYINGLGDDAHLLTKHCSQDVQDAMHIFIERSIGSSVVQEWDTISDYHVQELSPMLMFAMIVGYTMRSLEVRYDMQNSLDGSMDGSMDQADFDLLP